MAGNFFVKKTDNFTVTLPFDVSDPEAPQIIFGSGIESYPDRLNAVKEENIEYHYCKFRKPSWGLDCFVRELGYSIQNGQNGQERVLSQERLSEARIQYLLIDSSFFGDHKVSFIKTSSYEILSADCEEVIKTVEPLILRVFLIVASRVWDDGLAPKHLLSVEDYQTLRNKDTGIHEVMIRKGLVSRNSIINPEDPETKKN